MLDRLSNYLPENSSAPGPGGITAQRRNGDWEVFAFGHGALKTSQPIGKQSIWHCASIAKQFTAMAVLRWSRNTGIPLSIGLDQLLGAEWSGVPIRLGHLVFHTSGLDDQDVSARCESPLVIEDALLRTAVSCVPGDRFQYASSNYTLIALAIERSTGRSLAQVLAELVFAPAGMTAARCTAHGEDVIGYSWRHGAWNADSQRATVVGPEGVYVSLEDLQAWCASLDAGIFGEEIQAMFESPGLLNDGTVLPYGYGQFAFRMGDRRIYMHVGRDRSLTTFLMRELESGDAMIAMTNGACDDLERLCLSICGLN